MANASQTWTKRRFPVTSPCALRADAESAYLDLTDYQITVVLKPDGWHIDYELARPFCAGGGPHYVIDSVSGAILSKRYEQ